MTWVNPGCNRPRGRIADCVLHPFGCGYLFAWAELYPVRFVGCVLLTTSPVLCPSPCSICAGVRPVLFGSSVLAVTKCVWVCLGQGRGFSCFIRH